LKENKEQFDEGRKAVCGLEKQLTKSEEVNSTTDLPVDLWVILIVI